MYNPLISVSLNTKRIFVTATTPKGCQIIMPVNYDDPKVIESMKLALQNYLNYKFPLSGTPPEDPEEPHVA